MCNRFSSPATVLTLSGKQLSADEGCIHILQQYDALLWGHTQEMVQTVVWQGPVTQTHQTDAVAQLSCQSCAEIQKADRDICYVEVWPDKTT